MAYIYNLADNWVDAGVTYTSFKMSVTDTASNAASLLMDLQVGGSSRFRVQKDGAIFFGYASILPGTGWAGNLRIAGGGLIIGNAGNGINLPSDGSLSWGDVGLIRDGAANTLAQRNGVNAQTLRVYSTFTDASNYTRGFMRFAGNIFEIGSEGAGTGGASAVRIYTGAASGTFTWAYSSAGHYVAGADNTYDIGASGASRPRNLYMASWIRMATTTVASLPAAATAGAGARMFVTDALAPTFGSAVTGGGAVTVPVYSTGSAWNVG